MRTPSKLLPESSRELSLSPVSEEGRPVAASVPPGLAPDAMLPAPTVSRRSVTALLLAALAPAAGTAVALPKVVGTAAAMLPPAAPALVDTGLAEDPELLALGAELEVRLAAYRAAAERLAQACATAAELWPVVPDDIMVTSADDLSRFQDCTYEEVDHNGDEVWPPSFWRDGKEYCRGPKLILAAGLLGEYLDEVRADPEAFQDWVEPDLVRRIEAADRYEAACFEALEASGISEAKQHAELGAAALYELMFKIRERVPRTISGVLIFARAMAAFEEARPESASKGEGIGGTILGRGLADAVLRVAGVTT